MVYCIDKHGTLRIRHVMTETLRYLFWILLSLPILVIGIWLFKMLLNNVHAKYEAEQKIIKEKELAEQKRKEFEESYNRRRGGGGY